MSDFFASVWSFLIETHSAHDGCAPGYSWRHSEQDALTSLSLMGAAHPYQAGLLAVLLLR